MRADMATNIGRQSAPVSYGNQKKRGKPKLGYQTNGDARVIYNEYLGEVSGSQNFASVQYPVNPGCSVTFPWLYKIARNYEKYRFNSLKFCFETDCSTQTAGTVILSPDYDATDPAPLSKVQVMTYQDTVRTQAWTPVCMECSPENLQALPQYNIGGGQVVAGSDIKLSNVANLWLCTQGMANTNVVGELWVYYDVTLIAPDANSSLVQSLYLVGNGTVTNTNIFGTAPIRSNGQLSVTTSGDTITFVEGGNFIITYDVSGVNLVMPTISNTNIGTATILADCINAATTNQLVVVNAYTVQPGATLHVDFSGSTVVNAAVLWIAPFANV